MYDEVAGLYRSSYDEEIGVAGGFEPEVMGLHLMAMADCFDLTSEELYDCKRAIADWYREAIKGMIPWQKDNQDVKTSLMMAYSMLKACRLELLLADKYQKTGEAILETAVAGDVDGPVAYGALMLAYGEYLLLHDGEN